MVSLVAWKIDCDSMGVLAVYPDSSVLRGGDPVLEHRGGSRASFLGGGNRGSRARHQPGTPRYPGESLTLVKPPSPGQASIRAIGVQTDGSLLSVTAPYGAEPVAGMLDQRAPLDPE